MGNCQAIDAATLVIQHPSGRVERYYWPLVASEVMRSNPGHYVALVITLCLSPEEEQQKQKQKQPQQHQHNNNNNNDDNNNNNGVRFTRVKLLRPTDTLVLGQAYRLITSQEVVKGLWAKKYAKIKKNQEASAAAESTQKPQRAIQEQASRCNDNTQVNTSSELENTNLARKHERHRPRTPSTIPSSAAAAAAAAAARSRMWRPSLQSISEAAS